MAVANNTRAAELAAEALPYLEELLRSAPMYGSAGIDLIFHEGVITRVDVHASVQKKTPGTRGRA
jgi:hypothetical protein